MPLTVRLTDHRFPYYITNGIAANLRGGMRNIFKKGDDNIFSYLLEKDFLPDLKLAIKLTSIPEEEITFKQQADLNSLTSTYYPGGRCPSHLFPSASRKLQEEYNEIHNKICQVLYDE